MTYNLEGTIKVIMDTHQISETFQKREFVVETNDSNYPQEIKFQFLKDSVGVLDQFNIGDRVDVGFNIQGKPYTNPKTNVTSWFVNLTAFGMQKLSGSNTNVKDVVETSNDSDDDLPF